MAQLRYFMATITSILITAFYLKRFLGVYAIVVPLLYMFLDVNYSLRIVWLVLRQVARRLKGVQAIDALEMTENIFYVLPTDLDVNLHMNNARYLRECDFGRVNHWIASGIWAALKRFKCGFVLGGVTVRYRKSLELGDRVRIQSKILYWDQKAFYVEQRFLNEENFVCAVVLAKQSLVQTKTRDIVTPQMLVEAVLGRPVKIPVPPAEVDYWIEYNTASSNSLREERNKIHSH